MSNVATNDNDPFTDQYALTTFPEPQALSFTYFKYVAAGCPLSDDDTFALAIRTLGPNGRTLVIDDGLKIVLTHTVDIPYAMTITSQAGGRDLSSVITSSVTGDLFHIEGRAMILGLNFEAQSSSGSILILTGDAASVVDCTFSNVLGNASSMILLEGSKQTLKDDYFSNFEAAAYSWGATSDQGINDSSSVVGGWAYGPGKGGWIGSSNSTVPVSNFVVDGWNCITTGATQIEARAAEDLTIEGGIYDQSTQSAIVLGNGSYKTSNVTIDGAYISTAGNRATGIAINAAPSGGKGVSGLRITNNDLTVTGTALLANACDADLVASGNTINAASVGFDVARATGTTILIANQNTASVPYVGQVPSLQSAVVPERSAITATFAEVAYEQSATLTTTVQGAIQTALTAPALGIPTVSPTFSAFKVGSDGTVLGDDDALARAIAWYAPRGGTLVISPGTVLRLTRTAEIPASMQIVSDGSAVIGSDSGVDLINITAHGPVLLQGLRLESSGRSGSIVLMSGNNTVLRHDVFTNAAGNSSDMVRFGGPNELIEDSSFVNSDPNAYCWSAPYVNVDGQVNINSAVRGGSATGVGNGGLVGNATPGGRVEGFEVENWDVSTTGATQINATDVLSLHIRGGNYLNASQAAMKLGGGLLGDLGVDIEGATISGAPTSVGVDAAPADGVGVTAVIISGNLIQGTHTGISTNIRCGGISVLNNLIEASAVGLSMANTNAPALIVENSISAPIAVTATVAEAPWASQSYVQNLLNGSTLVAAAAPGHYDFVGNAGASIYLDSSGGTLQPRRPTLTAVASAGQITFSGVADFGNNVTVQGTCGAIASKLGTTIVQGNGSWQFTVSSPASGTYQFSAVSVDSLNNTSTPSELLTRTVDPLFDDSYYMTHYGDEVAASGLEPYQFYLQVGAKQGENPSAWFDTSYYLRQNPDVAVAGINPLLHYEVFGWKEGRTPSLVFSPTEYEAENPTAVGTDPLLYFMTSGAAVNGAAPPAAGSSGRADPLVMASYLFTQLGATLVPGTGAAGDAAAIYKEGGWRAMLNPDPLFDTKFYMASHQHEVLASGVDPLTHYETVGWKEGYDPSLCFSTYAYLSAHPTVAGSSVDPLTSYYEAKSTQLPPVCTPTSSIPLDPLLDVALVVQQIATLLPPAGVDAASVSAAYDTGAWRLVSHPNQLFDSAFYIANNPDVNTAGIDPLAHYVAVGAREGRDPNQLFDDKFYLTENPDVARSTINPLLHYEIFGWREGRNPSPLFDVKYYLAHNPDVVAANMNPLIHFESVGFHEGRNPDAFFDVKYYLAHNPDVAAAGIDPLVHYDTFGWKEGRNPSGIFDTSAYLNANSDVRIAGIDPLSEYLVSGMTEGRAIFAVGRL